MTPTRKRGPRWVLGLLLAVVPVVGLAGYFVWLTLEQRSGTRVIAPKSLVQEYDGPGALRNTGGVIESKPEIEPPATPSREK